MAQSRFRSFLSFLLILILLFSVVGCGGSQKSPSEKNNDADGPEEEVPDMYGYKFDILSYNRGNVLQFAPKPGDSSMGDAQLAHYDYIEDLLNISIDVTDAAARHVALITQAASAGIKSYDMADMFLSEAINLYKSGYFYTLNDLFDEDEIFSGKYGTRAQLEAASHKRANGTDYWGFICAKWGIPFPSFQSALYFNPQILKNFNQPDPHELLEQGNWTWANFSDICNALVGPGENPDSKEDDTFGIPNDIAQRYVPRAALTSNGVRIVYYDESTDKYETDLSSQAAVDALEFCHSLEETGALEIMSGNTSDSLVGNAVYAFMTGRCGFLCEYTYHGLVDKGSFSYAEGFEFEWTTFPWGPNGTYGKMNSTISLNDHFTYLPISTDEYEVQQILPYLLTTFHGCEENDWKEALTTRCFFSQKSADLFFDMYENASFDYFDAQGGFLNGEYTNEVISGKKTATEAINSAMESVKQGIEENRNALMLTSLD